MTDSFIQLTTDGSGKKLDTVIVNLGVGSTELHREKMIIADPSSSGGYANVTTSQGLQVQATGPVTVTSGLVSVTSGTITSTSATNPWSSAPGFNLPVVSVSSGLVQVSGSVTATAATNPWSSAPSFNVPMVSASSGLVQISGTATIVSASSGLIQISGTPTVVSASSGLVQVYQTTAPWSILSASSGLIQVLGNVTTSTPEYAAGFNYPTLTTAGALRVISTLSGTASTDVNVVGSTGQQVVVTSSGAMLVSATVVASTATGQVNIVGTSSAVAPATSSGGLLVTAIASTVWTVTATAATNPWSSAPGFNVPMVSASSGLVQISGTPTILSASSGLIQALGNVTTSTPEYAAGIQLLTLTTAGALRVATSASASGSTAVNLLTSGDAFFVVTTSWGQLVTHTTETIVPVLQASSGVTVIDQWLGSTAPYVGQKTMANSLPVTIASNQSGLTVVSASSGATAVEDFLSVTSSGLACFAYVSSSSVNSNNIQSGETKFWGYSIFNTTAAQRFIKIYNTSSAPTVGTTANWLMTLGIPGSTGGGGANVMFPYPTGVSTRGLAFTMTANPPTTDTGIIGNNDLVAAFFYSV